MLPPEEEELSGLQGSPGNGALLLAFGVCCLNGQSLCPGDVGVTWDGELHPRERTFPPNRLGEWQRAAENHGACCGKTVHRSAATERSPRPPANSSSNSGDGRERGEFIIPAAGHVSPHR